MTEKDVVRVDREMHRDEIAAYLETFAERIRHQDHIIISNGKRVRVETSDTMDFRVALDQEADHIEIGFDIVWESSEHGQI
jgi:amphi-Trp domain-containing protein